MADNEEDESAALHILRGGGMLPPPRRTAASFDASGMTTGSASMSLPPGLGAPATSSSVLKSLAASAPGAPQAEPSAGPPHFAHHPQFAHLHPSPHHQASGPLAMHPLLHHAESMPALRRRAYTAGLEAAPRLGGRPAGAAGGAGVGAGVGVGAGAGAGADERAVHGPLLSPHDTLVDDGSQASAGVVSEPVPLPLASPSLFEIMSDVAYHSSRHGNRHRSETHE
jgi:hypothetical protein